MKIRELKERLEGLNPESEIMILEGANGNGTPRTINFGPGLLLITRDDAAESADCEGRAGDVIVALGYGCY